MSPTVELSFKLTVKEFKALLSGDLRELFDMWSRNLSEISSLSLEEAEEIIARELLPILSKILSETPKSTETPGEGPPEGRA
jgi:hypothetical protein